MTDLPSLPESVEQATDPDCPTCGGIGWVCENHPDRPWSGMTTAPTACGCGAGMPCTCTGTGHHPPLAGICYDADSDTYYDVYAGTPAWYALLDWLRFHNLDPDRTVVRGSLIYRDAPRCRITYEAFIRDDHGHPVLTPDGSDFITEIRTEQGEAPPLPFPPELTHTC